MKTPEQFVNEDCSAYSTSATVKAVAARDREVAEACAILVAEFSRPHWTASRHLDDRDDAEAHEAVAMALEDAAKNLRARFATPSPETGGAPTPTQVVGWLSAEGHQDLSRTPTRETCKDCGDEYERLKNAVIAQALTNPAVPAVPAAEPGKPATCCDVFPLYGKHRGGCAGATPEKGGRP